MKKTRDYVETLIRDELYKMTSKTFMELWNFVYAGGNYIYPIAEFSAVIVDNELTPRDVVILTQNNHFGLEEDYFILDVSTLTIVTFIHQSQLEEKIIAPFVKCLYSLDSDMYDDFPKGTEGLIEVLKNSKQKTIKDIAKTIFSKDAPIFNLCPDVLVEEKIECVENCEKCIENFWNRPYEGELK